MFKFNISNQGRTYRIENESETIIGRKIGEVINGKDIDEKLDGYKIKITGTSDLTGIPGIKGLEGFSYHRKLLRYGTGMKNRKKGIRLRKTLRGEEISAKTVQINMKVIKDGNIKFSELVPEKTKEDNKKKESVEENK